MGLTFISGIIAGAAAIVAYQQGGLLMFAGGWLTGVVNIVLLSKWMAEKKREELKQLESEEETHD